MVQEWSIEKYTNNQRTSKKEMTVRNKKRLDGCTWLFWDLSDRKTLNPTAKIIFLHIRRWQQDGGRRWRLTSELYSSSLHNRTPAPSPVVWPKTKSRQQKRQHVPFFRRYYSWRPSTEECGASLFNVLSEPDGPLPRNAGMEERGHGWMDGAECGRELYSSGG